MYTDITTAFVSANLEDTLAAYNDFFYGNDLDWIAKEDGLYVRAPYNKQIITMPVSNFYVYVKSANEIINQYGDNDHEITLEVMLCQAPTNRHEVKIKKSHLDNQKWYAEKLGVKFICYNPKALNKLLMELLQHAEEKIIHNRNGWNGNRYITGSVIIGECESNEVPGDDLAGFALNKGFDPAGVTAEATSVNCPRPDEHKLLDALFTSTKSKLTALFLYLTLVLSFLKTPLATYNKQRQPQFMSVLLGPPSAGKTTLSKSLLSFYEQPKHFDLSSNTSEAYILSRLKEYSDSLMLIDDYKLGMNNDALLRTSETLIRLCGNAESSRDTMRGSSAVTGLAMMTAEILPDVSESSLNRIITHELDKGDIDFSKIDYISANGSLYAEHIYMLISWIADQGVDAVAKKVHDQFRIELENFADMPERRAEAYAWLLSVYVCVVSEYCQRIGFNLNYTHDMLTQHAKTALLEYKTELTENSPVNLFIRYLSDTPDDEFVIDDGMTRPDNSKLGLKCSDRYLLTNSGFSKIMSRCGLKMTATIFAKQLKASGHLIIEDHALKCRKTINKKQEYYYGIIIKDTADNDRI